MRVVIVGAGVAGVFTAIELIDNGYKGENITIVDKGNFIQNRYCFTNENTKCKKCKTCNLLCGFSGGGGGNNDGKLNLIDKEHPNSIKIGGDLIKYHSIEELEILSNRVLEIYNEFGMKDMDVEFLGNNLNEEGKRILEKAYDILDEDVAELRCSLISRHIRYIELASLLFCSLHS